MMDETTTRKGGPTTEDLVGLARASRDGELSSFFGFEEETLDRLELLAAQFARERALDQALRIARGVLALDPSREALAELIATLEPVVELEATPAAEA